MSEPPLSRGVAVGAVCWVLTGVYFVVEIAVAQAWSVPYRLTSNTISDLGTTTCGPITQFGGEPVEVCSPWHALMNTTFVAVGMLTALGAVFARRVWPRRRMTRVGLVLIILAGLGGVLLGLAPQDRNLPVHALGAVLQIGGAVAPLLIGLVVRRRDPRLAAFSAVCGAVGALASGLFLAQDPGLGAGLMERLAIWPLTIWTMVVGGYLLTAGRAERLQSQDR